MRVGVYPGSFDPITKGHLDLIERASSKFDKVIVAVLININKKGMFSIEERVNLIEKCVAKYNNVEVKSFNGLLIDFVRKEKADVIIKGLRSVTDFEYEFQMALMNRELANEVETVFMVTSPNYSYISSSAIKQVASFNGEIKNFVPKEIVEDLEERIISLRGKG
ncbi:pantetheine-phosphate adenylyltransferase [Clostridium sp.]|uniref:pantetheine-phosphate adenylyltransferase n=1 Tax=Clostridium sp. TaxID=1506 RepID=UPI00262A5773